MKNSDLGKKNMRLHAGGDSSQESNKTSDSFIMKTSPTNKNNKRGSFDETSLLRARESNSEPEPEVPKQSYQQKNGKGGVSSADM